MYYKVIPNRLFSDLNNNTYLFFYQDKGIDIRDLGSSKIIRDSDRTLIRRMYNCEESNETWKSDEDGSNSENDKTSEEKGV